MKASNSMGKNKTSDDVSIRATKTYFYVDVPGKRE